MSKLEILIERDRESGRGRITIQVSHTSPHRGGDTILHLNGDVDVHSLEAAELAATAVKRYILSPTSSF